MGHIKEQIEKAKALKNANDKLDFDNMEIEEIQAWVEAKKLYNQTISVQTTLENNDGKRITKSAGYIPVKKQVEILQDTGKKLELMREGTYDYQDENYSMDVQDPTRRLNFDLADASELKKRTDKEIKKAQRERYLAHVEKINEQMRQQQVDTEVSTGDTINKKDVSPKKGKGGEE